MDIKKLRNKINTLSNNTINETIEEKGISIIIPVYDGYTFIQRCLQSIVNQNINTAIYEVILILNGKFIRELEYLLSNNKIFSQLNLVILISDDKGASQARNLGIKHAKYSHIVFLDVDDFISQDYIQSHFDYMEKDSITISQIRDVRNEELLKEESINDKISEYLEKKLDNYRGLNRVLTITACKAIPKSFFLKNSFRENLKSGEDTVLFTEMIIDELPNIKIIPFNKNAVYFREITEGSVSRQERSFEFNITHRIDILKIFDKLLSNVQDYDLRTMLRYKYNAQIVMMNSYLKENVQEFHKVVDLIREENFSNFSYKLLNKDIADTLVISYCAPPYSDTSATVVSKRIIEAKKIVDIVSNRMNNIRSIDSSLQKLVNPFVSEHIVNQKNASFSNFYFLGSFVDKVFEYYCKNIDRYQTIYSRAMFPISHFPPLFIKILNKDIKWVAEFSDPLLIDIESRERNAFMEFPMLSEYLESGILGQFTPYVDDNLFNLAEIIAFALADELIFTNNNQLEFMINRFPDHIKEYIIEKSTISEHPTLSEKYYHMQTSKYEFNKSEINIGYFGNFYSRRGIEDILKIYKLVDSYSKTSVKFHIFTNTHYLEEEELILLKENNIKVNNYLPYLEFLNIISNLDILLLFDSITSDIKFINPYLPSKLSDYLGSSNKILAVVEKGSVLSSKSLPNLIKLEHGNEKSDESKEAIYSLLSDVHYSKQNRFDRCDNKTVIQEAETNFLSNENIFAEFTDFRKLLIKPRNIQINSEDTFQITIENSSLQTKIFSLKSYYSVKNIIRVCVQKISSDYEYEDCISKFRSPVKFNLSPGETMTVNLNYLKNYNKEGFRNAGRLLITELK